MAKLALGAAVVAVLAIVLANSGTTYDHTVQVTVPEAFEVIPGERMVQAGITVGSIISANVTKQAQAHIVMGINDSAWPLPTDTVMYLRMGGTIKYTDRFVQIVRGNSPIDLSDGAALPPSQFIVPVEYDSLFNIFNGPTRAGLKSTLDNGGPTFYQAAPAFHRALGVAPPAIGQADAVFRDLGYDQAALSTLVSSTAEVSDAVANSNPGVQTLLTGAASTFSSMAAESAELQRAISAAPPALNAADRAASHISSSLELVSALSHRLSPGVTQLIDLAKPLNTTLHEVVSIEPTAVSTLSTIKRAGPDLTSLLHDATVKLMPELQSVGRQAAKETDCVRPYTPDIVGFLSTWGGFLGDGLTTPHVHFFHGIVGPLPFPNTVPIDTEQMAQLYPSLSHSYFPQVPGESWNQPWWQPQCNITEESTSPANDTDNHTFDPYGGKAVPYGPTTS